MFGRLCFGLVLLIAQCASDAKEHGIDYSKFSYERIPSLSHSSYKPIRAPYPSLTSTTTTQSPLPIVSINCNRNQDAPVNQVDEDYSPLRYLEKAKESISIYQDRVFQELEALREKENEFRQSLVQTSSELLGTERDLTKCRTGLKSAEATVSDLYAKEKDCDARRDQLEIENEQLRDRLRSFLKLEIRRADRKTGGNRAKAMLVFNNKTVASFRTVRYSMDDESNLFVEEVVKRVKVPIVRGFDHLKIVRLGTEYLLSLSNQRGNQFFEHKKYDNFYSSIPDEAKLLKPSMITTDKSVSWTEMNSRCGFWACLVLKPSSLEAAPEVWTLREKTQIGAFSPTVAYFEYGNLVVHDGHEEHRFSKPTLDKSGGVFYVRESGSQRTSTKKAVIDMSALEIVDQSAYDKMLEAAFP